MKINIKWFIKIEKEEETNLDDFLNSFGYEPCNVGDSDNGDLYYFYNPMTQVCVKYGRRKSDIEFNAETFQIYSSMEELIDAHFTGANNEEV